MPDAVVSLLTSFDFLPGVKVLSHSIRRLRKPLQAALVLLITPDLAQHEGALSCLGYDEIIVVNPIPNPNNSHVQSWVQCGFTKLRIWQLNECGYDRVFYIDADCAVVNPDFDIDAEFSRLDHVDFAAAPDFFPPDCFNAGVMLIKPSSSMFSNLLRHAASIDSYDGGDTGYLNQIFKDWYQSSHPAARLPFSFNAQRAMRWFTRSAPAYWNNVPVSILHYSSNPKPWQRPLQHSDVLDFEPHSDPDDIFAKLMSEADLYSYTQCHIRWQPICNTEIATQLSHLPSEFSLPPNTKFGRYSPCDREWLQKFASVYNILRTSPNLEPSIPEFIHQIWLGDREPPFHFSQWVDSLINLNPKFGYKLWRDQDVEDLHLIRRDLYEQANTPVQRSDILRWELLYQFGGIYADMDVECVASFANLLTPFHMVVGLGNTGHIEIMNSFIAASPRHPVVLSCLKSMRLDERLDILQSTGPGAITRAIGDFNQSDLINERVAVMPPSVLYPLPNRMRFLSSPDDIRRFISDESFAIHHWSCSWQNEDKQEGSHDALRQLQKRGKKQDLGPVCSAIIQFL